MTLKLEAKRREIAGRKLFSLRAGGIIPAVLYGHGVENENLQIDLAKFEKIFATAGENTMVDLSIDGAEPVKTMIADVQYDPVKHKFIHADFKKIKMDEKVTAAVPIEFIGEAPIIKSDGGSLVHNISEVEIRCLPADLIHEIKVDVSGLNSFDDVVTIKDLKLSDKLEIIGHEPEDVIVIATPPRVEEEPVIVPAEGEAAPAVGEGEEAKTEEAATAKETAK